MKSRITIYSRVSAADTIEPEATTYPASPRGAKAAWEKMVEIGLYYRRIAERGVGRVICARIGEKDITDDLQMIFSYGHSKRLADYDWDFLNV